MTDGNFMDVGVNIGQTLLKLRSVNDERAYIGFEPNPECVYYVSTLIRKNRFTNIQLIPTGLFDRNAILSLHSYSDSDADQAATLIDNFRTQAVVSSKFVPVFNYAELIKDIPVSGIGIIKIDVEGAELEVLESLAATICLHQPVIFIEILPVYRAENTSRIIRQEKIEALLAEWRYTKLRVQKSANGNSVEKLLVVEKIGIHSDIAFSDYVLVPAAMRTIVPTLFEVGNV